MRDLYRQLGLQGPTEDASLIEAALRRCRDPKIADCAKEILLNARRKPVYDRNRQALVLVGQLRANLGLTRASGWIDQGYHDFDYEASGASPVGNEVKEGDNSDATDSLSPADVCGFVLLILLVVFVVGAFLVDDNSKSSTAYTVDGPATARETKEPHWAAAPNADPKPTTLDEEKGVTTREPIEVRKPAPEEVTAPATESKKDPKSEDKVFVDAVEFFKERLKDVPGRLPVSKANPKAAPFNAKALPLPRNGLAWRFDSRAAVAPFEVVTRAGDGNYFVKLVDLNTKKDVLSLFVQDGQRAEIQVPLGSYELRYAVGKTWYGTQYHFGPETRYARAEDHLDFKSEGNSFTGYTVELYLQRNGNLETEPIAAEEF